MDSAKDNWVVSDIAWKGIESNNIERTQKQKKDPIL
jgi:hypothetical protein